MKRYVQSKWSKDAPVWEVYSDERLSWIAKHTDLSGGQCLNLVLPKSEYHEVLTTGGTGVMTQLERWERVVGGTVQMSAYGQRLNVYVDEKRLYSFPLPSGYRWAWDKQEDGTLVIERKVTE